jgi:hypothetical protein
MQNVPTKPPTDSFIWETIRNSLGDSQNSKLMDPEYRANKITTLAMTQAAFWGAFPGISWAAIAVICSRSSLDWRKLWVCMGPSEE